MRVDNGDKPLLKVGQKVRLSSRRDIESRYGLHTPNLLYEELEGQELEIAYYYKSSSKGYWLYKMKDIWSWVIDYSMIAINNKVKVGGEDYV
jgi:hypothetical protein